MKHKQILNLLKIFSISLFISTGCQKEFTSKTKCQKMATYVNQTNIDRWLSEKKSTAGETAKQYIDKIRNAIAVEELWLEKFNESETLLIVPLTQSINSPTGLGPTAKCYLIIVSDEEGKFRIGNIAEIIPESNTSGQMPKHLISNIYNNKPTTWSGNFNIYSLGSRFVYGLEFDNGRLHKQLFRKNTPTANSTDGRSTNQCTDWFLVTFVNGVEVSETYLYTTCGGGSGDGDDCATALQCGPDGTGFSNGEIVVTVDSVKILLANPCLANVIAGITDTRLKNQIAKLYQQTFVGTGAQVNLTISEVANLTTQSGNTLFAKSQYSSSAHHWKIFLNSSYTAYTSKEFMGLNVFHELVHSFIRVYQQTSGVSLTQFDHHKIMFEKWVNQIKSALIETYNLTDGDATALALQGLDDVLTEEIGPNQATFNSQYNQFALEKYGINLFQAREIFNKFESGEKGTKCQ